VAPSSAKIGSFSETFSQCFFNEMNRPVIIQQVVLHRPMVSLLYRDLLTHVPTFPSTFCRKNRWRRSSIPPTPWIPLGLELVIYFCSLSMTMIFNDDSDDYTVFSDYTILHVFCVVALPST
jgi:hypothetical protein